MRPHKNYQTAENYGRNWPILDLGYRTKRSDLCSHRTSFRDLENIYILHVRYLAFIQSNLGFIHIFSYLMRCLAQGHLDTQLGASHLPVTRQPALPPELSRPCKNKVDSLSHRGHVWIKEGAGEHRSKWSSKVKQCHLLAHPLFIFFTKREGTSWEWTLFI